MSTTTEAHREAIARKVRALLNKTVEAGCTEEETMAAAARARAIMDAHRLTQSDLEVEAEPVDDVYVERPSEQKLAPVDRCWWGIARYCGVKYWYTWKLNSKGRLARHARVLGLKSDVEMAVYLYKMIGTTIEAETRRYHRAEGPGYSAHDTLRRNTAFRVGMAQRVAHRLVEMAKALEPTARTATGTALVVVKGAVVDAAFDRLGIRFNSVLHGPKARDASAYHAGIAAGDRVNLSRPVGGAAQGRIS